MSEITVAFGLVFFVCRVGGVALARGPWQLLGLMGMVTLATTVGSVALPAIAHSRRPSLEQIRMG